MLKLGIVATSQLANPRSVFGRWRHANLLLLRTLWHSGQVVGGSVDSILAHVRMPNGTWRDTHYRRFAHLDDVCMEVLSASHNPDVNLRVLDLAASSGSTSAQFYRRLAEVFTVRFVISDLNRDALAVRSQRSGWTVVFGSGAEALQLTIGPFVLQGQGRESLCYPVNRLLRAFGERFLTPRARRVLARQDTACLSDFGTISLDGYEITKLPLVAFDCMHLIAASSNVTFESCDIVQGIPWRADVVRAMNILTPVHLQNRELRCAIRNCLAAVSESGLLVVGRSMTNDPRDVRATIYRCARGVPQVVREMNGGCEIGRLILEEARWQEPSPVACGTIRRSDRECASSSHRREDLDPH